MNQKKVYSLVGFARKAGKLALGTTAVEGALFRGKAKLVLLDDGASKNTKNRFIRIAEECEVPVMGLPPAMMSDILKWQQLLVAAVVDEGFALSIEKAIREKVITEDSSNQ